MSPTFRVGDWLVEPAVCRISREGQSLHVRAKVMDLLTFMAARPGEVLSKDALLNGVWGTEAISESALTRTVTELRHALGDDVAHSTVIETIPKRGYRLIASVEPPRSAVDESPGEVGRGGPALGASIGSRARISGRVALLISFAAVALIALAVVTKPHSAPLASSIAGVAPAGEEVTSASLPAVRLYHDAYEAGEREEWPAAYELAKQAVQLDPGFATAEIWLAWSATRVGRPKAEFTAQAEHALAAASRVLPWEREWIRGSYFMLTDQTSEAIPPLEALLRLRPDHHWAARNLFNACVSERRFDEATPFVTRAADLLPRHFRINFAAAEALIFFNGDPVSAMNYVRAAEKVAADYPRIPSSVRQLAWVRFFPAFERWSQGDVESAHDEFERTLASTDLTRRGSEQDYLADAAGEFALTFGQLRRAREFYERVSEAGIGQRAASLAILAFHERNDDETLALLRRRFEIIAPVAPGAVTSILAARLGLTRQLSPLVATPTFLSGQPGGLSAVQAELALQEGRTEDAIADFADAVKTSDHWGYGPYWLAADGSARALLKAGRLREAIQVLETAGLEKVRAYPGRVNVGSHGFWWIQTQAALVELYHKAGREADEARLRTVLLHHLKYSDSDHPIRLQLEASHLAHPH